MHPMKIAILKTTETACVGIKQSIMCMKILTEVGLLEYYITSVIKCNR